MAEPLRGKVAIVTGGSRGIGRAIVERLLDGADDNVVAAIELDPAALAWVDEHSAGARVIPVVGDAADEGDEYFYVRLVNPTNAGIFQEHAYAYIYDDDASLPRLSVSGERAARGRTGPGTARPGSVTCPSPRCR